MRILTLLSLLVFSALPAAAQNTLVTGTIKDPNGLPYSFASVKMQLVVNGSTPVGKPTVTVNNAGQCSAGGFGSAPCQIPISATQGPISTDATGSFTLSLSDNSLVTPAGTQWLFTVTEVGIAPPLGTGSQSFSLAIGITGASQSVSAALSAIAPALTNFSSVPVTPGPPTGPCTNGQIAVDSTTGVIYTCQGGTWVSVTVTNGAGPPPGTCQPNQLYVDNTTGLLYTCSGGTWKPSTGSGTGTVTGFTYSETGMDQLMTSTVTNPSTTPNLNQAANSVAPGMFLAGPIPTGNASNPTFENSFINQGNSTTISVTGTPLASTNAALFFAGAAAVHPPAPDGTWTTIDNFGMPGHSLYFKNLVTSAQITATSTISSGIWTGALAFLGGSITSVPQTSAGFIQTTCNGIPCRQGFLSSVVAGHSILVYVNASLATFTTFPISVIDSQANAYQKIACQAQTSGTSTVQCAYFAGNVAAGSPTIQVLFPDSLSSVSQATAYELAGPTSYFAGANGPWAFRFPSSADLTNAVAPLGFTAVRVTNVSGCTPPSANTYDACEQTITWPVPFADSNYFAWVSCKDTAANGGNSATNDSMNFFVKQTGQTASQVVVITQNNRSIANACPVLQVFGLHP